MFDPLVPFFATALVGVALLHVTSSILRRL
jgi:hypothetical protein